LAHRRRAAKKRHRTDSSNAFEKSTFDFDQPPEKLARRNASESPVAAGACAIVRESEKKLENLASDAYISMIENTRTWPMSSIEQRRAAIVELVQQDGFAAIDALAQKFSVTPQTIRRDINELCARGALRRFHGGASLSSNVENLTYQARQVFCLPEKRRIAALLADHIPDHASLFINIGTTTEEIAKALLQHQGLSVVTNNLNVANILSENPDFQVIVAGGLVRAGDRGIVGEATIDLIHQFKVDIGIIGISAIDSDGSLLDFDYREVRVAQAIIANSRQVYLAADRSKFERGAMVRLGTIEQVDALFTDSPPPAPVRDMLSAAGVKLHVAETDLGDAAAA
jgi:DeoR family glycerol-3-phosphate regulon repressor